MCKDGDGAVAPLVVVAVEDGVDDPIHALDIHTADPRASAAGELIHTPRGDFPFISGNAARRASVGQQ